MAGDVVTYKANVTKTVTIALASATSAEIDLEGYSNYTLITPAALDAATISFLVAEKTGGTFTNLHDCGGTEVILVAATNAARAFPLNPATFCGMQYIKIRNGGSTTYATQAAARTFYLTMKT
jgi:hypothetical protein